jgi:hypothetical protein
MEWEQIGTAPLDGTEVMCWREDSGVFIARYTAPCDFMTDRECEHEKLDEESMESYDWFYADFVCGGRLDGNETPTHWMPLPEPPTK